MISRTLLRSTHQEAIMLITRYRRGWLLAASIIALLMITAGSAAAQDDGYTPTFEPAACMFEPPPGQEPNCGYVIVPEDRDNPDGAQVRLAVAVFPSSSGENADPIIYLEGGPGGAALQNLLVLFDEYYAPLTGTRDLVIFDQRGVGLSQPSLFCHEYVTDYLDIIQRDPTSEDIDELAALLDCQERLLAEGINLAAYNSVENAADVRDIASALGYDEVNLFGVSYGSRLALTVMRDHPEIVRSTILGGAYPPQVNLYTDMPASIERVLNLLFARCAEDEVCDSLHPELRSVFLDLVETLDDEPVTITIPNLIEGGTLEAVVDSSRFIGAVILSLYASDIIPQVPRMIYDFRDGDTTTVGFMLASSLFLEQTLSRGMYFSVQCHEEVPFSDADPDMEMIFTIPELGGYFSEIDQLYDLCAEWQSGTADALESQPVTSDIPTLLIAGEFDPVTPPEWSERATETLANSYYVELPGLGHDASLGNECALSIQLAFLDDPSAEPSFACAAELPTQVLREEVPDIVMEPFSDNLFGISGVAPQDWQQVGPGTYQRGLSSLDVAVVIQQAAPLPRAQFLELVLTQLDITVIPDVDEVIEINDIIWSLYRVDLMGFDVDLALGEADNLTLFALLQAAPGERDMLYETVFVPIVEAMQPLE
jgi:pimeloyl-ACP methyl ester carboxylesterase